MELQEIKRLTIELMDALKSRGLAEVSLDTEGFKIAIRANTPTSSIPSAVPQAPTTDEPQEPDREIQGTRVTSPLVGTFYAAPSPEEPPYIEVGQNVRKGDTLFIIEAMKTMNEISAPCDGMIRRILAQSGDMVEYGQTLVVIA